MSRHPLRASLLAVPIFLLAACGSGTGGGAGAGGAPTDPARFVTAVAHPYFPITSGTTWTYLGDEEGLEKREVVHTLPQARRILGVPCTGVRSEVHLDGILVEVTTEWFAQDGDGNVWKFGEESIVDEDGTFAVTEDSWLAGVDGVQPWMAFSADPLVGDRYLGYAPDGTNVYEVGSVTATANVPAGFFGDCLQIVENPDDPEDRDIILYAPGVGRVSEQDADGHLVLVSVDSTT